MRLYVLATAIAVLLLAGCGKSDEHKAAEQAAPERNHDAPATAAAVDNTAGTAPDTADQPPDSSGDALLTDPDSLPLDEEDDGGDGDTDPAGNAGTPSPDQTGSINHAAPAAPAP